MMHSGHLEPASLAKGGAGSAPDGAAQTAERAVMRAFAASGAIALTCAGGATVAGGMLGVAAGIDPLLAAVAGFAAGGAASAFLTGRTLAGRLGKLLASCAGQMDRTAPANLDDLIAEPGADGRTPTLSELEADIASLNRRFASWSALCAERLDQAVATAETQAQQNQINTRILTGVGHELRSPLNSIIGYALLLHEDAIASGDTAAVADLERIAFAGRTLLGLVNDLLVVTNDEAARGATSRSIVDFNGLLRSMQFDQANGPYASASRQVEIVINEDSNLIYADAGKLRQCLNHLLDVYCRIAGSSSVTLEVSVSRDVGKEATCLLTLSGAAPSETIDLTRILDEWETGEQSSQSNVGKLCLDLSIARRLARLMLGDVETRVGDGGGLELQLWIPVEKNPPLEKADDTPAANDGPKEAIAETVVGERTALIIDDNPASVDLMRRWLAKLGYRVMAAGDGDKGLTLARDCRPDLIILDVYMPGRSGYDVLAELRSAEATSETPVILVTVDDDRARALEAGATDFIRKPAAEEQVRSMLEVYQLPVEGRILVIEDNDDAARIVERCASQVGFTVSRVANGLDGLEAARTTLPDAIVLDLSLPGLDGFKVMEALQAEERLAAIPVIVVSAGDISVEKYRQITQTGYRFFSKAGLSPRELAAQLREIAA